MSAAECNREIEIIEAVTSGRWPEACPGELQEHAQVCSVCAEALRIAVAFREERAAAVLAARVPSAGLVWWRAEMRARRDAVNAATRPMRIIEWIAAACEVVAAIALIRWFGLPVLADLFWQQSMAVLIGVAAVAVLAPIAFYFAFSDD
jgi:hypothetical protein